MPRVAVIIPAYNAEKLLRECLDSVLAQTFDDLEIAVVDDGSTDSTPDIASSYPRVTLLRKPNGGLADARNYGVSHTHAPWLTFLDADDTIPPHAVEWLYSASQRASVVSAAMSHRHVADLLTPPRFKVIDAAKAVEAALYQTSSLVPSACGKLVARDVMERAPFRVGTWYEDLDWFYRAFDAAGRVAVTDAALYYYRPNPGSFTNIFSRGRLDVLDVTARLEKWTAARHPAILPAARDRRLSANFDILTRLLTLADKESDIPPAQREALISECHDLIIRYRRSSIFSSRTRLKNRLGSLLSYLGLPAIRLASHLSSR